MHDIVILRKFRWQWSGHRSNCTLTFNERLGPTDDDLAAGPEVPSPPGLKVRSAVTSPRVATRGVLIVALRRSGMRTPMVGRLSEDPAARKVRCLLSMRTLSSHFTGKFCVTKKPEGGTPL